MEPQETVPTDKIIRLSKKKFWGTIIVIVVLTILWIVYRMLTFQYGISGGKYMMNELIPSTGVSDSASYEESPNMMPYPDYYQNKPNIEDTRQFLKTNYSSEIKTRDVRTMTRNVKGLITDIEGRIDSLNTSDKSSYISFVVPAGKFESFRDEVENLTSAKLYTENVSSENRLGQKQSLEQQTQSGVDYLASLQSEQQSLTDNHNRKLSTLQSNLATIQKQLSTLRNTIAYTSDETQLTTLRVQETEYVKQEAAAKKSIVTENTTYNSAYSSLSSKITNAQSNLANLDQQDSNFRSDIETVNGTISINWVSYWEIAKIYSPIHPTWIIIIIILILLYIGRRSRFLPKVELV